MWEVGVLSAKFGFLSGAVFSIVLMLMEGRRTLSQMSMSRFAGWGAAGGLLLLGGLHFLMGMTFTSPTGWAVGLAAGALLGAGTATGSLAVARKAEGQALPAGTTSERFPGEVGEETELLGE
jgi:hypothetical protein